MSGYRMMRHVRRSKDELQKDGKRRQQRGRWFTLLSFIMAVLVMISAQVKNPALSLAIPLLIMGCLLAGCILLFMVGKRFR